MRLVGILINIGVAIILAASANPSAQAAGQTPDAKTCADKALVAQDRLLEGGCIAILRAKGNCQACHFISGVTSGNIAPPLAGMAQRFPDRARLRAQIEDPNKTNPATVMPPYGKYEILTADEIDKLVDWLLTL